MDHSQNRQIDYLALQVERLADAVGALANRVGEVEIKQRSDEAVKAELRKRKEEDWKIEEVAWRAFWGAVFASALWLLRFAADHIHIKK